ncbi:MAG: 4-hydroxy-3-methylbut-2-enyl diphosphate reductase, partial [Bacillota bacterium]|nr:4-hydroxy-3-methylbut-2-enyl diphosphate reductase [Bacillota bacterium]
MTEIATSRQKECDMMTVASNKKNNDPEVILAENAGFCFGVKRALQIAENRAKEVESGKKIYTLGSIIHNDRVVRELEKKGVHPINSLDEAESGSTVIIRSHGEPKSTYDKAEEMELEIVDATCPYVEKIHRLVANTEKPVLIVGNETHPEVIGIRGWSKDIITLEEVVAFADRLKIDDKELFVVCQTTIKQEILDEAIKVLEENGIRYELHNTICSATTKRQEECEELAKSCDTMVVIGDKKSSNSRKLFEIANKYCNNTYFIENIEDLSLHTGYKCNKIGVVAGASTPDYTIKEVIANMCENKELTMAELLQEVDFDKSLKLPRNGEIVEGKVHQVNEKDVIVNLGVKKDGILPKSEASLEEGQKLTDVYKVDDVIKAKVIKTDDGDGGILLSTKKLEYIANWEEIVKAYE